MRAALLCNGPSRVAFKSREGYTYVMGCNIPWADVDGTTIVDVAVIRNFATVNYRKIDLHITRECYNILGGFKKDGIRLNELLDCKIIPKPNDFYSSGHMAALSLIEKGYTDIDIYGCDSYFEEVIDSFTWQFVPTYANDKHKAKQIIEWRKNWASIKIDKNVKLNFIKS
jgi:hypothetical protein